MIVVADNGLLARYDVRISFDGPALVAHEIDAEVFASSLQAHAKLIKEACGVKKQVL